MRVVDVCNYNPETTILAHVNVDGGCMGGKSSDISAMFSCSKCHEWLDSNKGTEEERIFYTRRAMVRTWMHWTSNKVIKI
jgi:hypothetical protein